MFPPGGAARENYIHRQNGGDGGRLRGVQGQTAMRGFTRASKRDDWHGKQDHPFISFRKSKSAKGVQDNLIHCCADHSQYDPARGAQVLSGPASQPLCAQAWLQ